MDVMITVWTEIATAFETPLAEAGKVPFLQFATLLVEMIIVSVVLPLFLQTVYVYSNEDSHNDDCQDDWPVHDKVRYAYKQD